SYYEYRPLDLDEANKQLQPGGFVLGNQIWPGPDDPARPYVRDQTPDIADITVDGLTATGADQAGIVTGLPERSVESLTLKNINTRARRGLLIRNAAVSTQAVAMARESGPSLRIERGAAIRSVAAR